MPDLVLTLTAKTATTATFAFANLAADGTLEVQISPREDFQFCVCPIYTGIARATPYVAPGLNQDARYFARARPRRASGAAENWSATIGFKTPVANARDLTVPAIVREEAIIMRPEPILSWTAGNAVAGFPAKNVSRDAPVAWRSISPAVPHSIILEHSGAPIDTIPILNTNLPEDATAVVRGANTLAGVAAGALLANAVPFRASANMPGRLGYHGLVRLAARAEYPFIGIYLTTPTGTPANMLHAEHILLGLNRKTKNIAVEDSETPVNLGSKDRTRTGLPDRIEGLKLRRGEFDLAFLTETQSETLYWDVLRWLDEPVFVAPNSKAGPFLHDRLLYGDLKGTRRQGAASIHQTRTFIVESLI